MSHPHKTIHIIIGNHKDGEYFSGKLKKAKFRSNY
jgi:hypothetical protein